MAAKKKSSRKKAAKKKPKAASKRSASSGATAKKKPKAPSKRSASSGVAKKKAKAASKRSASSGAVAKKKPKAPSKRSASSGVAKKKPKAPSKRSASSGAAKKKAKASSKRSASSGAAKKKTAGARKKVARRKPATEQAVDEAPPAAPDAEADATSDEAPRGRPAAGGLRRGSRRQVGPRRTVADADEGTANGKDNGEERPARTTRRRSRRSSQRKREARDIPPLPEDDDDFVPPPPRDNGTPAQLLEKVRRGSAHISAMNVLTDDEVKALAGEEGLAFSDSDRTSDIVYRLVNEDRAPRRRGRGREREREREREDVRVEGLLELHPDGYGFLRRLERSYSQHPEDVYVSANLVRKYLLKPGHWISGQAHRPRPGQAYLALHAVEEVNHEDPAKLADIVPFKELTVVYPDTRLVLETDPENTEMRVMDLFCPLGMGQRALIVAAPRSGKTVLLTKLADAIAENSPNVDIVVLLVDERPEEVTNMRRSVRGEVIASTFDKPATNHVRVAELVMDKVRRMVEFGRHVVLLLDSITRLGRAYNNQTGGSGRILSGGLDANALSKPKRFFGSARNVEGGGSLTIIASALVDTGSKMDQVIFEEFKGTGNMEVVLSRDLANARVWPAIDVPASGTRNEDLLLHPDELQRIVMLRRGITGQDPLTVMQALRVQLKKHSTNAQFLMGLGEGSSL